MSLNRFAAVLLTALLTVLAVWPGFAWADDPLITDPCGRFATTEGGEPVTPGQYDVCTADVAVTYGEDMVLTVTGTLAGDVGDRTAASYHVSWVNGDGCRQHVELADPMHSYTGLLFKYSCENDQIVSFNNLAADACQPLAPVSVYTLCVGEAGEYVQPHGGHLEIDGATFTISLPLHSLLEDPASHGFAPGAVLADTSFVSYVRASRANTLTRSTTVGLLGVQRTFSVTDEARGRDLVIPPAPAGWEPTV